MIVTIFSELLLLQLWKNSSKYIKMCNSIIVFCVVVVTHHKMQTKSQKMLTQKENGDVSEETLPYSELCNSDMSFMLEFYD